MSIATVQEIGQTAAGKPKVKVNGTWYFLDRDCHQTPSAGQSIEYREESFTFGDGKQGKKIMAWKPAGGSAPAPAPNGDYIDEASMRFISNVVGSGISAGTIKEPGQILSWFNAAKAALTGKAASASFDDDVGF